MMAKKIEKIEVKDYLEELSKDIFETDPYTVIRYLEALIAKYPNHNLCFQIDHDECRWGIDVWGKRIESDYEFENRMACLALDAQAAKDRRKKREEDDLKEYLRLKKKFDNK